MILSLSKKIRKFMQGETRVISNNPVANMRSRFDSAKVAIKVISCFYFWLFLDDITHIISLSGKPVALSPPPIGFWMTDMGFTYTSLFIYSIYFFCATACIIRPDSRWLRVGLFLSVLNSNILKSSLSTISYDKNGWIWLAFALIFLPNNKDKQKCSEKVYQYWYLTTCWFATALTISVYTMSGMWKILSGFFYDGFVNNYTFLSSKAMSYHLASHIFRNGYNLPAAEFVIENHFLGWAMLSCAVYLQFFSFWIPFRPLLFAPWLLFLAAFHTLNLVLMNLPFNHQGFIIILLLGGLPFLVYPKNFYQLIVTMPLAGKIYSGVIDKKEHKAHSYVVRYGFKRP